MAKYYDHWITCGSHMFKRAGSHVGSNVGTDSQVWEKGGGLEGGRWQSSFPTHKGLVQQ